MTDKTFKEMMAEKVSKNNEGRGVIVGIGPDYGRYVSIGDDRQWIDMSPSASQIKKYDKGQEGAQFDAAEKLIDRSAVGENPSTDVGTTKFEESKYEENGKKLAEGMQEVLKGKENPTAEELTRAFNISRDMMHRKVADPEVQEILNRSKTKTEPTVKSLSQMISEKNTTRFVKGNNPTAPDH